jgi:uncharacterized protein YukE
MNPNDLVDRALTQARELQKTVAAAVNDTTDKLHPILQESMRNAADLQQTLAEHATQTTAVAQEQTNRAMGHLAEFMKIGADALRSSGDHMREASMRMMDQTRKTIEHATSAMGKRPEDADLH